MADTINLSGLAIHAHHGVTQSEAEAGQVFRLDLVLLTDLTNASRTDKLKNTVPYEQVASTVKKAFCTRRYQLVEAAAGAVADALLESFPAIRGIQVTVYKSHAPVAATIDHVGVTIRRQRPDTDPIENHLS